MATKVFGWVLLLAGLVIISLTLYSSYNMFTGKTEILGVFKMEEEIKSPLYGNSGLPQKGLTPKDDTSDIQTQIQEMIGQQIKEVLPSDALPKILNLTVWTMLAGLLIFGGAQISNLGIKLIKR